MMARAKAFAASEGSAPNGRAMSPGFRPIASHVPWHNRVPLRACRAAGKRFQALPPARLQHAKHGRRVHLIDRHVPERRGKSFERVTPLLAMLGVAPFALFALDQVVRAFAELDRSDGATCPIPPASPR